MAFTQGIEGASAGMKARGATLVELLLVVVVLSIMALLFVSVSGTFKKRAEKAKCLSHMRTLHTAFVGHLTDKGHWPQMDENEKNWGESEFFEFWITSLEPYGVGADTWLCPSDKVYLEFRENKKDVFLGSYVPTPFDKSPGTPFRWGQPWLVERGDFHGKGSHMLMPDGSVQDSQNPFYSR